jgi:hypothetical protein
MHVLDYLADPKCERKPKDALCADFRLLCSGTLYRDLLGDWTKSEAARILLDRSLLLFATSRPFDDYSLELVLQLTVPFVEEKEPSTVGTNTFVYHPDEDVAT